MMTIQNDSQQPGPDHVEAIRVPERAAAGEQAQRQRDATSMIVGGAGIGLLGVVTAAIGGALCPVCVVAAPVLMGVGAFRRWKSR